MKHGIWKRSICALIILTLLLPYCTFMGAVAGTADTSFAALSAKMMQDYWEEGYISVISMTVGENVMLVDGTAVALAEQPVILAGEVLLPLEDLAGIVAPAPEPAPFSFFSAPAPSPTPPPVILPDENGAIPITAQYPKHITQSEAEESFLIKVHTDGDRIIITRPYQTKQLIVILKTGRTLTCTQGAKAQVTDGNGLYLLQYTSEEQTAEALRAFEKDVNVGSVKPNTVLSGDALSWGTTRMAAEQMKQHLTSDGKTSETLIVAVVDTGIDSSHTLFKDRLVDGYDFVSGDSTPQDDHNHGTHVSGTIADCTPANVKIMPLKALNSEGKGSELAISLAVRHAADKGAKVINMSLGGIDDCTDCVLSQSIDYAIRKGVTVVVAAGNDTMDTVLYCPAKLTACVTVAATDANDFIASFSNYGNAVDLAAPGVNINSAIPGGKYGTLSGTSMAAPHATAGAALLLLETPALSPAQVESALRGTTVDLGPIGWDPLYGTGVLTFAPFLSGTPISPTNISLSEQTMAFDMGINPSPKALAVTITPFDATDKSVTYTTSNAAVAMVSLGKIVPKGKGTATITVKTSNGLTAACEVTVEVSASWLDVSAPKFAGGNGTKEHPFLINTPEQLAKLTVDVNAGKVYEDCYFLQTSDIDLSGRLWIPIRYIQSSGSGGMFSTLVYPFRGNYDGGYHTISNLSTVNLSTILSESDTTVVSSSGQDGLFGNAFTCTLQNIGLVNANTMGDERSSGGVLSTFLTDVILRNCYVTGTASNAALVGDANRCIIENCYAVTRSAKYGLFKALSECEVRNCFAAGVPLDSDAAYSFVDSIREPAYVDGHAPYPNNIANCFSTLVSPYGLSQVYGTTGGITQNYYYNEQSPSAVGIYINTSPSQVEAQGKPLAFFTSLDTYTDESLWDAAYPWDFTDTWAWDEASGLPYLKGFDAPPTFDWDTVPLEPGDAGYGASEYLVYPTNGAVNMYIDLGQETLTLPATFTSMAYSVDGGKKWKTTNLVLSKLLSKKALTLYLTDSSNAKTHQPGPDAIVISFPTIEARPAVNPDKLVVHYGLLADDSGATNGAWTLAKRGTDVPAPDGYEMAPSMDRRNPDIIDASQYPWYALPDEGIPVLDTNAVRQTYLVRYAPVITADKITPASKTFSVKPLNVTKAPNYKADYKKEIIKPKAGMTIFGGTLEALAALDAPLTPLASATSFTAGSLYVLQKSDKTGVPLTGLLDGTDADTGLTQTICIWQGATAKKPAGAKQVYILAIRASLPPVVFTGSNGRVTLPKTYEVWDTAKGKWTATIPRLTQTVQLDVGVRFKSSVKANGFDDSAQSASSKASPVLIEYGVYTPEGARTPRSGLLRVTIGTPETPDNPNTGRDATPTSLTTHH